MSTIVGYARSHRLVECLFLCLVAAAATRLFRDINRVGFERWNHGPPYPVLVLAPLIVGCVAVGALFEPFGDLERSLTRQAWTYRLAVIGSLSLTSGVVMMLGLWPFLGDGAMAGRNLAAMTGTAAWIALWIGSRLAWLPTTILYVAMYSASAGSLLDRARFPDVLWEWPLLPSGDWTSLFVAASLTCGIPLVCWRGPRELAIV